MVVYGVSVGTVSISELFLGGIIPGFLLAGGMSVYAILWGKKNMPHATKKFSIREVWSSFKEALWALGMPLIILGGIYAGIFTATEAAVVSVIYGLLVSTLTVSYTHLDVYKRQVSGIRNYTRESGIGINLVQEKPLAMFATDPALYGKSGIIALGKKSGKAAVEYFLDKLHLEATSDEITEILARVKSMGQEEKRLLTEEEFLGIYESVRKSA